jgi:hypothetical protein
MSKRTEEERVNDQFYEACSIGDIGEAEMLIEHAGADPRHDDDCCLQAASEAHEGEGDIETVTWLFSLFTPPIIDKREMLQWAVNKEDTYVINCLLNNFEYDEEEKEIAEKLCL